MKKAALWAGVVLVLLLILRVGIGLGNHKSDQAQIKEALQESIQASKEGRPGGVMELLSSHVNFNQQDASGEMGQVAQYIKNQRPAIHVVDQDPIVTGDSAQISSPVDLTLDFLGQQKTVHLKNVVLIFKKESATSWLIIPTQKWKLAEVDAPEAGDGDFIQ